VTRGVCEIIAQTVAQAILKNQNQCITLTVERIGPKMWPTFLTLQNLPKVKKIAQWAKIHPIWSPCFQRRIR
jgi:hypothetical protein